MWNLEGNVRHSAAHFMLIPCKERNIDRTIDSDRNQAYKSPNGIVMQYSYCSVISWFPRKTVHPFRNFLAVLPPPYAKLKLEKNFWCSHPTLFVG